MSYWIRFYDKILDDADLQSMPGDRFRFLCNCWLWARRTENKLGSAEKMAWRLRLTTEQAQAHIDALSPEYLVIANGSLEVNGWEEWQCFSDSSATRVKKYRDARKNAGLTSNGYAIHRDLVFERDGGMCVYCGSTEKLVLDHLLPVIRGGDDDPENLVCACKACNSGKAGRTPDEAGMKFLNESTSRMCHRDMLRLNHRVTVTETVTPSVTVTKCHAIDVDRDEIEIQIRERAQAPAPSPEKKRFSPPSTEQVREYAAELGYAIDAERFCAYHGSRGWVVGRAPMKNWKMAVVTWRSNDNSAPLGQIAEKKSAGQLLIEKYEREEREELNRNAN